MIVVRACSLTPDDFRRLGNNVAPAVQRERRRPPADLPISLPILPDRGANRFRPTVVMFNTQGTSPAA